MSKKQEELKAKALKDIQEIISKDKSLKGARVRINFKDSKKN